MGFVSTCCKWLLFISNFLIFALSCAGLGLGIWILVDRSSFLDLLDQTDATVHIYESTAVLILIVTIGSIFITFFGCCGAYKESKCMLGTYFLLVLLLLILSVAGIIVGWTQGFNKLSQPFLDTLSRYELDRDGVIEQTWDNVQTELRCCGVDLPNDWTSHNTGFQQNDNYLQTTGNNILIGVRVPESCCVEASNTALCMTVPTGKNGVFVEGCFSKVKNQMFLHIESIGGVSIAVIIIMVINLILSLYLCTCGLEEEDDRPRRGFYKKARQDRV